MRTVLYNTQSKKILKQFKNGYFVDGKKPELPNGIVELEVVIQDKPELTVTQKVERNFRADIENGQYIVEYNLVDKTTEELDREQRIQEQQEKANKARNFLENLDLENMKQSQLKNAVKALVILNR